MKPDIGKQPTLVGETMFSGEFGWTVARKDSEACHALCIKCGWMSHFDIKQWEELNRR